MIGGRTVYAPMKPADGHIGPSAGAADCCWCGSVLLYTCLTTAEEHGVSRRAADHVQGSVGADDPADLDRVAARTGERGSLQASAEAAVSPE